MPRNKNICVAALTLSASFIAQDILAKDRSTPYERSVYSIYQSLPVNEDAADKTVKTVRKQFPGWVVTADKLNGQFTDIYGAPLHITGNNNSEKARACVTQKLQSSGLRIGDWKQVSDIQAPKADYINYIQEIDGHSVAYSRLSFRFTKSGDLARIQMSDYGHPKGNTTLSVNEQEAKKIALQDLGELAVSKAQIATDWEWYPVPAANGYSLHPAWHFDVEARLQGNIPLSLTGYIDAVTGAILERTNETKEASFDLTVKGMVYKGNTSVPPTAEPLANLELTIDSNKYFTDAAGRFSSSLISLPSAASIPLKGKWSTVIDSVAIATPSFNDTVLTGGGTFLYPTVSPSGSGHVNAYYHVNKVHDFMKGYFTTFTRLDTSLTTNVELTTGSCNAYYTKSTINFYKESSGCNSFAEIGDIVYHEYGHGISDLFYRFISSRSMRNGALNEGCSDIWAISITHNPILGENVFKGSKGSIRRYDGMPQVYPLDLETNPTYASVHKNGQIIAGTWWDVAKNLGSVDSMTKLFTDVYYDVPDGAAGTEGKVYQSILVDALMADDDNSNLLDGTPHYKQIVAAFAKHGIYLGGDVKITHTELTHQVPFTPIEVKANLSLTTKTYFHDLTMYYRINGAGTWTPVVMTDSSAGSLKFSGFIPAQLTGTVVEYYFIVHDGMDNPTAFFPITCNPALADNQRTLPYQFGVGVISGQSNSFESVVSGWLIGGNSGDDASAGLWKQTVPVKNPNFNSFPAKDHTTGTGKCLVTGNGVSGGTFGLGVTSGTSTVLSPIFSISGFTSPVIEYYRWFSNEQGFSNFKNDPWIVKVRNSASAPWTTVENTYQGDNNWRRRIFRLSTFMPSGSRQVQLMFVASDSVITTLDNDGGSSTIGGIDDVFIYDQGNTLETPAIPATRAEIYPNPADDKLRIVLQTGSTGTISLYDMMGKKVAELAVDQNNTTYNMDTKSLAAGQYNLLIQTNLSIQTKNVIIVHN